MKKFLYSKKGKVLLFFLQMVAVCTAAVSCAVLFLYTTIHVTDSTETFRYRINWFDSVGEYEDSDYFNSMLENQVSETIRYAVIRNQMEVDGKFDGKKEIDIEAYAKRYELVEEEYKSIKYSIEDLIKWGQYGVEYTNQDNGYATDLYTENMPAEYLVESQELQAGEMASTVAPLDIKIEASDAGAMAYTEVTKAQELQYRTRNGWELVERYKSIEGKKLSEYVTEELSYDDLCEYLESSAKSLAYNYSQYKKYNQLFKDNKTNLSYYITLENKDGSRSIYTNIEAESAEAAKEIIEGMGKYINYDAISMSYTANANITEEQLVKEINYYDYTYSGNSQVLIGIDTRYLYQDKFLEGYNAYRNIVPKIPNLLLIIVIGTFLTLILLGVSTAVAGHTNKEEELKIVFFDRLYTEVFFLFFVIGCGGLFFLSGWVANELYYYEVSKKILSTGAGIAVGMFYCMFYLFWLSLVRRIKLKALWNYSLIRAILGVLQKGSKKVAGGIGKAVSHIYNDSGLTTRTWLPYMIFLLGNLILLLTGPIGFIIALIIDIGVGSYQFRENKAREKIVTGIEIISEGDLTYQVSTKGMHGDNLILAQSVNTLGEGIRKAVETSMKDERLKADLITNVSHDIKTPLTSIINYVDLIKRENIQDERIRKYIEVLDAKSQRLKHLTEDLVEASKISSGNITLVLEKINIVELVNQSIGEFSEKYAMRGITLITNLPEHPVLIEADSRRIWRVMENLGNNVLKYAMENTRVYLDVREVPKEDGTYVVMSVKNISQQPLNIQASELTERFIRGDVSRSTEGSGLGLSIAKNLTELQKGKFDIYLDGDLFKVSLEFKVWTEELEAEEVDEIDEIQKEDVH